MSKNKKKSQNTAVTGVNMPNNQHNIQGNKDSQKNNANHKAQQNANRQKPNNPTSQHMAVKKPKPLEVTKDNKYVLGGYFGLGLNNFFKAILSVFTKTGIKVASNKGAVLYPEEKIGAVLRTLYYIVAQSEHHFTKEEIGWANNLKLNTSQQLRLQKLLFHHFPILGPVMAGETSYKAYNRKKSHVSDAYTLTYGVTLAECLDVLSNIAQGLVDCRNSYTHYDPHNSIDSLKNQYELQSDIVGYLDKTMVASRRIHKERNNIDKERNSIDTAQMEFLTGCAENLEAYKGKYGFYPKYDKTVIKDQNGKSVKKVVERDDFFYKIGKKINFGDKSFTVLSGFGLTYFCAIFLSKSQTKQMLADIKLFESSPYPAELNEIVRDMMCIYRIRAPRGRKKLESGDSKVTLALDVLNELRKCPKELFDVLTPKGQEFFEENIDESKEGSDGLEDVVKRIRHTDRFPHLAMKYIDETELFKNIRFQVQLGKYRFKFYDKKCINGEEDLRILQKEINGFGRIQAVEAARKEKYKGILQKAQEKKVEIEGQDLELDLLQYAEDTGASKPYITDSRAFYNIHNNRIGLYWKEHQADGMTHPKPGDYLPDLRVTEAGKADVDMPAPMAMMSIYELPALVFYQHLMSSSETAGNKKKNTAEQLILNKYYALKQFFSDVSSGALLPVSKKKELEGVAMKRYGLKLSEIPEKLVEYLSGAKPENQAKRKEKVITEQLIRRLRSAVRRRDHYVEDRKKIGDKDNKYAKKAFVDVRHGVLGRYLSESLVEWQPTANEGKDKLTGMNFNKLQAELATFSHPEKFPVLKKALEEAGMLSGSIAHPFLGNVMNRQPRNIEELYLFYLNEEVRYLKSFFNLSDHKGKPQNDSNIDFDKITLKQEADISGIPFVRGKARWQERDSDYYRNLANRYLEIDGIRTSIWLPDGIFTKAIVDILKEQAESNPALAERLGNDELNNNVAYLINTYFETVLDDHSQIFYRSFDIDTATGKEKPNKFARVYGLFNILNDVKVRNALVDVPMTCNEITARLTEKAVGWGGEPLKVYGPKNKPMRAPNGDIIYKKRINQEITDYVDEMKDKGNHATLEEAKEAMTRRLIHCISDVKNNERTVRRYKTQDMVLFLIASQLMGDAVSLNKINQLNKFSLKNVCSKGFLNQTVNFEFPVQVDGNTVYVSQDNMSLKNYGEFYHLLSDDRLPSLLSKLAGSYVQGEKNVVDYNKLMGELTSYDLHRSLIFRAIHQLERRVTTDSGFKSFLNNPSDVRFYIDNDKSRMAKRNNFSSLLKLLEQGDIRLLNESERELIVSIRNAFSHNHYKVDFNSIAKSEALSRTTLMNKQEKNEDNRTKLTTIATLIWAKLEELQNRIIEKK